MKKRIAIFIIVVVIAFVLGVLFTKYVIPKYFNLENVIENEVIENEVKDGELSTGNKKDEVEKESFKDAFKTTLNTYEKGKGTMYTLVDIQKDGVPELIVRTGEFEAEYMFYIYEYNNSKVELIGNIGAGHTTLYEMNDDKYLLSVYAHMGYEVVAKVSIENDKIKYEQISQRENLTNEEYSKGDKVVDLYDLNDISAIEE